MLIVIPRKKDHPRRCGENSPKILKMSYREGSPPQVRGKLKYIAAADPNAGITPAGAGKTHHTPRSKGSREDHPRRCGENHHAAADRAFCLGSPPQVRGKLNRWTKLHKETRITPAGAGKTLKRSFRNQPFCSRAVQISFNFSNSLNVSLQSGSAR